MHSVVNSNNKKIKTRIGLKFIGISKINGNENVETVQPLWKCGASSVNKRVTRGFSNSTFRHKPKALETRS